MLATAQLAAIEAERKVRQEKPKRKHHYTGNAPQTKCYHAQKQQKVVETGQSFIHHQFFTRSKCLPELAASSREESGEEDGDTELEEICELEKSAAVHKNYFLKTK